ncbi:hypothetical protein A2773_05520 [Candidatus Gottesmanbacteria bacterium RIFCSPHIGHO2_01_FULL_39_10]|uniref:Uncharacterized protein n=1 Tax=Candidatus Gottesmanbacteria bacterium RIFCSPHIGHO2_01_FULL_39_10 TaxID=1798375 RepID=A0A1F5ZPW0_9BACT|nr:MAG: hypothetical protein A2773_05520 [Candidatus Gottesmanbacteria bacterium RIFCSPHIGHO2_01_FULL_39_10]
MITMQALLKTTPLSDENRKAMLDKLPTMTEDQKFRLAEICWTTLSTVYQIRLKKEVDRMMWEMAQGEKQYSKNDFEEMKAKLYFEFAEKLEASQTEEDMVEVKKQLERSKNPS